MILLVFNLNRQDFGSSAGDCEGEGLTVSFWQNRFFEGFSKTNLGYRLKRVLNLIAIQGVH